MSPILSTRQPHPNGAIDQSLVQTPAPRPIAITPDPAGIPAELRDTPQWGLWRYALVVDLKQGKRRWTKVPKNAHTDASAKSNDPTTWATFAQTWAAYERGGYDGIGFFLNDNNVTVCDLDHCRDPQTGEVTAAAAAIATRLGSYTEPSVSGTGLHIFMAATKPAGRCRKGDIELYDRGRFITVTGRPMEAHATINARQAALDDLHAELFPAPPAQDRPTIPAGPVNVSDEALIAMLERSQHGAAFAALYRRGDLSGRGGDASGADYTVVKTLIWATNHDLPRADRLFRQSALMRDKWDSRRGETTYGERTLTRADSAVTGGYDPKRFTTTGRDDLGDLLADLDLVLDTEPDEIEAPRQLGNVPDEITQLRAENARLRADLATVTRQRDLTRAGIRQLATMMREERDIYANANLKTNEQKAIIETARQWDQQRRRQPDVTTFEVFTGNDQRGAVAAMGVTRRSVIANAQKVSERTGLISVPTELPTKKFKRSDGSEGEAGQLIVTPNATSPAELRRRAAQWQPQTIAPGASTKGMGGNQGHELPDHDHDSADTQIAINATFTCTDEGEILAETVAVVSPKAARKIWRTLHRSSAADTRTGPTEAKAAPITEAPRQLGNVHPPVPGDSITTGAGGDAARTPLCGDLLSYGVQGAPLAAITLAIMPATGWPCLGGCGRCSMLTPMASQYRCGMCAMTPIMPTDTGGG